MPTTTTGRKRKLQNPCVGCNTPTSGLCQRCKISFCSLQCLNKNFPAHRETCPEINRRRFSFLEIILACQPRKPGDPIFPIRLYKPPKMATIMCVYCMEQADFYCEKCETSYCSSRCQKSDWLNHKLICLASYHDDNARCNACGYEICFFCKRCHNTECEEYIKLSNWTIHRSLFPIMPELVPFD
ncbi:uncharacterized protein LOC119689905 isoform X2 [Teleopsis dalmanni]|uniref:uncharacterized protein LOC119689905 isoform X2 n=1 Tax=Teleopsis dalmanni TaxID=139649 RepID=UPI0018CF61C2|nr:uncharacterized protein LOC119689905 isoform X2 [Teleopsis dalmanni]